MGDGVTYRVGILGIQGAFFEHKAALLRAAKLLPSPIHLEITDVRKACDITDALHGVIIPGGESTVISMFLKRNGMDEVLKAWTRIPHHVTWGTCAGMILLAEKTEHQKEGGQPQIGGMDVVVDRNYFGRQVDSFEADVNLTEHHKLQDKNGHVGLESRTFKGVFIRAPGVIKITNKSVKVLATLRCPPDGELVVAVEQSNLIATAFHPELTDDLTWHLYFLRKVLLACKL